MSTNSTIFVGSRKSQLALIQTNKVIDMLRKAYPQMNFKLVTMDTIGDQILDLPLSKIGEKGLFTKELEAALESKAVHMVVHSLKDLPTVLPEGMCIGAVCKRDDPYDGIVMRKDLPYKSLAELPEGSIIGTSSLRRIAQLKKTYPHLKFKDIRGNLNTRFKKLDDHKEYSAIVLAIAGLERMDLGDRLTERLNGSDTLYAVAQGAMAVECRQDDERSLKILSKISDALTVMSVVAERAYLATLQGGCTVPIGIKSSIEKNQVSLTGCVYSTDGSETVSDCVTSDLPTCEEDIIKSADKETADNSSSSVDDSDHNGDSSDEPKPKKLKRNNSAESLHYDPDIAIGIEFSGIYANVPPGCLYGTVLRECQLTGEKLAKRMLSNGADRILEVTKKACAEEIAKRKAQLLAKKDKYNLKEEDIPNTANSS